MTFSKAFLLIFSNFLVSGPLHALKILIEDTIVLVTIVWVLLSIFVILKINTERSLNFVLIYF